MDAAPELAGRDLDLLLAFRAVAQAGGITAAERRLGIERSVISRQVKALEERLGGRLCERGPRGFELTELGQAALSETAAVHDLFTRLNTRLGEARQSAAGALTLAVADNCMTNRKARMPELLSAFMEAAPRCRLSLNIMPPMQIRDALKSRQVDVAVIGEPFGEEGLAFTPHFSEEFRLYVSVGEGETVPHLCELRERGIGLVVREGERTPAAALGLQLDLDLRVNASGLEAVALLLATGRFSGLLPTHLAEAMGGLSKLREVKGAEKLAVSTRFGFAHSEGYYRSPAVDRFFEVGEVVYPP
ncbi:MAG: LysR family transcriptional regulator [Pseudomonadota bacterium]